MPGLGLGLGMSMLRQLLGGGPANPPAAFPVETILQNEAGDDLLTEGGEPLTTES